MAVKRLEERLQEYNILEAGWKINYDEGMNGGPGRVVYPVEKHIGNKVLTHAIKVVSIPREEEEQLWKQHHKSESAIKDDIKEQKEKAKKEYDRLLEFQENNHVMTVIDVIEKTFDLISEGDQLGCDIIIRMEYLSSLEEYLFENNFQPFSNEEIVNCGIQICTVLENLHGPGIVHCDIKPGNIFVKKKQGRTLMFCLGDFGSAKESSMGLSKGRTTNMNGTEWYVAPYWENTQYRIQRDLYALGLTLYWMATGGNLPYEETNCQDITQSERDTASRNRKTLQQELPTGDINDKIAGVIKKACNFVPTNCYVNATKMREALEKIKDSKGQNVEKNIIKVENENTENVVSDLELTVPEEKIKQKTVERMFTKQDYKGEQTLIIGDEYTGIADYALQGTPIIELVIGASVKTFGRKIWANCRSLKKLKVENYEVVYEGDFDDCDRLQEVILPNCKHISKNAFSNSYGKRSCMFLELIDAPKCKKIGENAFEGCIAIEKIELLECTEVGQEAFRRCERITIVHMPKCERIGKNTFAECGEIQEMRLANYLGQELQGVKVKQLSLLQCKMLSAEAFLGYNNLEGIELPICEEVGRAAFAGCIKLRQVYSPKCRKIGEYVFSEYQYRYGERPLSACMSLEKIELPECEAVGEYAFSGCIGLRHVIMPQCRRIGNYAFSEYRHKNNLELLSDGSFSEKYANVSACRNLEIVELPKCEEVGKAAFAGCERLRKLNLPRHEEDYLLRLENALGISLQQENAKEETEETQKKKSASSRKKWKNNIFKKR